MRFHKKSAARRFSFEAGSTPCFRHVAPPEETLIVMSLGVLARYVFLRLPI